MKSDNEEKQGANLTKGKKLTLDKTKIRTLSGLETGDRGAGGQRKTTTFWCP